MARLHVNQRITLNYKHIGPAPPNEDCLSLYKCIRMFILFFLSAFRITMVCDCFVVDEEANQLKESKQWQLLYDDKKNTHSENEQQT